MRSRRVIVVKISAKKLFEMTFIGYGDVVEAFATY